MTETAMRFELAKAEGPGTPFSGPDDFRSILADLGGGATLMEAAAADDDAHDEDGYARRTLGFVSGSSAWEDALELVRRGNEWVYTHGDCWHFALALHRLYALELVAVEGEDHERGMAIHHVAARLPDGRFLDIRGLLDGEEEMRRGMRWHNCTMRPCSKAEIIETLNGFALDDGCDPLDWDDPEVYPFAGRTAILASFLFGNEILKSQENDPASCVKPR